MDEMAKNIGPMMQIMMTGFGALSKSFYQKYGKEALPIVAGVMSQGGMEWGKLMQKMTPVKGMKAYGESFKAMSSMMGMGAEVVELSDNKLHFKMSKCPFGLEGTSKELCEAMMNLDKNMMSTFLGKQGEVKVLKTVAAGDKICEIIESIK
jgi:predicted hydrocarbon binding protein